MAGALWGPYGFIVSTLGTLLANICTFTTSRVFFSKRSSTFLKKHLPNLSHYVRVLERHDWKFVAAIQLKPIVPAASMGYLVGLCTISLKRYVFLSFLFTLPLNLILNVTGITAVESVKNTEFIALLGLCVLVILMISLIGPSISNKIMKKRKTKIEKKKSWTSYCFNRFVFFERRASYSRVAATSTKSLFKIKKR